MSYLALARKWRPKKFLDVVGQNHVIQALKNALETERVHHAYLFSGTRGVGKTTVARILAKALNCEEGVVSEPCGNCPPCISIDEGRFVDLIEVDAASRTKVDDTRELLENVQYTPAAGRFKVYLIDEVHMLSKHSFNALLKTLEEPPQHVKFLLATTDPQQLPVTVLSRCLQFNLKRLSTSLIVDRMQHICTEEKLVSKPSPLKIIAQAASGSMRDALSLLDQAMAFGGGRITDSDVNEMLGNMDKNHLHGLLILLKDADAEGLMGRLKEFQKLSPDYLTVLDHFATVLQQIAVVQLAGLDSLDEDADKDFLSELARSFEPETTQLFYQIAITGRRDIGLAPNPQIGFEMTMLRMLSFRPALVSSDQSISSSSPESKINKVEEKKLSSGVIKSPEESAAKHLSKNTDWVSIVEKLNLSGASRQLAEQCAIIEQSSNKIILGINDSSSVLLTDQQKDKLTGSLKNYIGSDLVVEFRVVANPGKTMASKAEDESTQKLQAAKDSIAADPKIKELADLFDAEIEPESIRPLEKKTDG
ncbi:MAG: DNA polymerase III subunit gamma/tau [Pseudomonadota bacterium]|nr:DNA polymerase III subunit gamma/tau [Pseudomonadota bacterium]